MTTFRNDAKGTRGILLKGGTYVFLEPGEAKAVPGHKIVSGLPEGVVEVSAEVAAAKDLDPLPDAPADLAQLDHDGNGNPGGSLPHDPPALTSMTKAELEAQAGIEGVDMAGIKGTGSTGNVIAKDIRDAIEAKRNAG